MTGRAAVLAAACLAAAVGLSACADVPVPPEAAEQVATAYPAVVPEQSEQVRAEVGRRLLAARVAGDVDLVDAAATGPAAELEQLGIQLDGPQDDATAVDPVPASVLVAPQVDGWPRWFAAVSDPASDEASDGGAVAQELPVIEVYSSPAVRTPYRLWARLTMLPGAELPAFASPVLGAPSLGDGPQGTTEGTTEDAEDADDVRAALTDLAARYASVMTDGAASPSAAQFQPDPFVAAVRARTEAERESVGAVADLTVVHEPYGDGELLFAARAANGDVLAVTAVSSTTTIDVRAGAGELRPSTEVRAAAGIEQTRGTLTTRSVAALAFVVPAEQGAIRLLAVEEGLVAAEAS